MKADRIELGRLDLSVDSLLAIADDPSRLTVDPTAMERVASAHERRLEASITRPVYGLSTGVGGNKTARVVAGDEQDSGEALLRSHCVGLGPVADPAVARVSMIIRLNQLLKGGSGISPDVVNALSRAIRSGATPDLHDLGSIGTADLGPLAELALALRGEGTWRGGDVAPVRFNSGDALPFISSSALTLARTALAVQAVDGLLYCALVAGAMSFEALGGSAEAYSERVFAARSATSEADVARELTRLLALEDLDSPAEHVQDAFGLRALPQVHGAAHSALGAVRLRTEIELNAAIENPLVTDIGIRHHGQFHLAGLSAVLDQLRASLVATLSLSAARTSALMDPKLTGQEPFLASGIPGRSGLLMAEYVVQDELATARVLAGPVTSGVVNISLGTEEHASFATQSARFLERLVEHAKTIVAAELLAATRALSGKPNVRTTPPVHTTWLYLDGLISRGTEDRSLGPDLLALRRAMENVPQVSGARP